MGKKNEYVFNIGFNKNNPEHKAAADLLNRMGHTKADYIAKAVLFYSTHEGKGLTNGAAIDYQNLEQMVRKILEETNITESKKGLLKKTLDYSQQKNDQKGAYHETELEDEDMTGILKALEGFRK